MTPQKTAPVIVVSQIDVDEDGASVPEAPAFNPGQIARAQRQERDDAALQKLGWRGIGLSDRGASLMESMEAFTGGKIMRTIDATHGMMMKTAANAALRQEDLIADMEKIRAKYLPGGEKAGQDMSAEDMAKTQMLHDQWMGCAKIQKDCNGEATKAAHIRVMIAAKTADATSEKRNKKPAWKRVGPGTGAKK